MNKAHLLLLVLTSFKFTLLNGMQESDNQSKLWREAPEKNKNHPKPSVFVRAWQNLTPHKVEIYSQFPEKVILHLSPGHTAYLDQELIPDYAPMGIVYSATATESKNPDNRIQLNCFYFCGPTEILNNPFTVDRVGKLETVLCFYPKSTKPNLMSFDPNQDINRTSIGWHVILKGNRFEESCIQPAL